MAHYYNRNTRRFLRFAPRGAGATIHRALWPPGVRTRTAAVNYVHDLLLKMLGPRAAHPVVWDLGCGIGASLFYLAERLNGHYVGITISESQIRLAERLRRSVLGAHKRSPGTGGKSRHGSSDPGSRELHFLRADFCNPTSYDRLTGISPEAPSLIYLIESFGHATDPHVLLSCIAAALAPDGLLVICDDFPASESARDSPEVQQFVAGWRISSFWTPEEIGVVLGNHGLQLIENRDLTAFVERNRLRDRLIRRLIRLPDLLGNLGARLAATPFWGNMRGGSALQRGLEQGSIRYRMLVFGRR